MINAGAIGATSETAALVIAIGGVGLLAVRPNHARLIATGLAALTSIAVAALVWALLAGDFSLVYVAEATSRTASWPLRFASLWGAMNGSLLFWTWLASLATALVGWSVQGHARSTQVLLAIVAALLGISIFLANPFARLDIPAIDGGGLMPILDHPAMLYHPPLLYLGQVLALLPLAFSVTQGSWLIPARRAAGWSWSILTIGLATGALWAYAELGWGGYWAWDPVENGGFLPWLGLTLFLHLTTPLSRANDDTKPQQHRQAIALAGLVAVLTLVGVTLTRSGAATGSVHAFGQNPRVGWALLALIIAVAMCAAQATHSAKSQQPSTSLLSSGLRIHGLILGFSMIIVALGTLFPLLSDLVSNEPIIVNGRFFALFLGPAALITLGMLGVVHARDAHITRRLLAIIAALIALVVAALAGVREPFALLAAPLAVGSSVFLVRVTSMSAALLAHLGAVVLLSGFAGSTLGHHEIATLRPDQQRKIAGQTLRYDDIALKGEPGRQRVELTLTLGSSTAMNPEQLIDATRGFALAETDHHASLFQDVQVAIRQVHSDGQVILEVTTRPLLHWIWIGAALMAIGGWWSWARQKTEHVSN